MTWTLERIDELKQWADKGLSVTQIGIQMQLTRNQVMGAVVRNQIILKQKKTTGWSKYVRKQPPKPEGQPVMKPKYEYLNDWFSQESSASVHFDQMHHMSCRFPLWGTEERTGMVCGQRRMIGSAYCPACTKRLSVPR